MSDQIEGYRAQAERLRKQRDAARAEVERLLEERAGVESERAHWHQLAGERFDKIVTLMTERDALKSALAEARALAPYPAPEAGTCPKCNGPVYHRDGKPGEFDHDCSAPPAPEGTDDCDQG